MAHGRDRLALDSAFGRQQAAVAARLPLAEEIVMRVPAGARVQAPGVGEVDVRPQGPFSRKVTIRTRLVRASRLPTTDGRELLLRRYTQPEAEHRMLLQRLHSTLPGQPQPKTGQAPSVPGPPFGAADRLGETGIEMTHAGALVLLAHPPTQVST